jgi:hypothetical protein
MTASMDPLLSWLLETIEPLRYGVASPQRFSALLRELGWDVPVADALLADEGPLGSILADLNDVVQRADDLRADLAALDDGQSAPVETLVDVIELSRSTIELCAALADVADSMAPLAGQIDPLFLEPGFWTDLAADLPGYLLTRALRRLNPTASSLLYGLGIIEREAIATATRTTELETLRWDRLADVITRPSALLADVYGWDSTLDVARVRSAVLEVALACGLRVELSEPDADFSGSGPLGFYADATAAAAVQQVSAALVSGVLAGAGWVELGLRLVPVPVRAGRSAVTGIYLGGYSIAEIGAAMAASPTWRVELGAGAEAALGGVHLDPSLSKPAFIPANGEAELGLSLIGEPAEAWRLISLGGPSLSVSRLELSLRATSEELVIEGSPDLLLGLAPADGDGFIQKILGSAPLSVAVTPRIGWSSASGVFLAGGEGLAITLPLSIQLGPLHVDRVELLLAAEAEATTLEARVSGGLALGPFALVVDGVGLSAALAQSEDAATGGINTSIAFLPPHGLGIALDLGELGGGGGYLYFDPAEASYAGVADVDLLGVGITAIGLLTTRLPGGAEGWSLFLALSATFTGLQLGFGFTLNGVGGVAGIDRGVDIDALSDGVRSGALDSLLFPDDPVADAPRILSDLDAIFPPATGQYVFGPIAKIGWGTPTVATVDLGIVIQLPDPLTISLLGSFEAILPTADAAVLELRIDVAGTLDVTAGTLAIDASLHDSQVAGLALSGDVAIRAALVDQPSFLMSFGGWNPRFVPPANFPALDRLSVALDGGDALRIELAGYFAITSNSVQFGSSCDVWAHAVGLTVEGDFTFDALLQFDPFWFVVDLGFSVSVSSGSVDLLAVYLDFLLEGPQPWHALGTASVKILGIKTDFQVEATLGGSEPAVTRESIDVGALLVAALEDPAAWSEAPPDASGQAVTLSDAGGDTTELRVHPSGVVEVRERVAPLERDLERYGDATVTGVDHFSLSGASIGGAPASVVESLTDWFAPAQYFDLSETEKLSSASFEEMPCGLRIGDADADGGPASDFELGYEEIIRDPDVDAEERALDAIHVLASESLSLAVGRSPVARRRRAAGMPISGAPKSAFGLIDVRYVVSNATTGAVVGTVASGVSWSLARTSMIVAGDPGLQVVPSYEAEEVLA